MKGDDEAFVIFLRWRFGSFRVHSMFDVVVGPEALQETTAYCGALCAMSSLLCCAVSVLRDAVTIVSRASCRLSVVMSRIVVCYGSKDASWK